MYYDDLGISVTERTKRLEDEILNIIKTYWLKHNFSPTVREIAKKSSVSSTSTVLRYLNNLQEKGLIEWQQRSPRTIQIIDKSENKSAFNKKGSLVWVK